MFKQSAQFKKIALISGLIAASVFVSAEDMQYGITPPEVNAQSYILMDYYSGAVLTAVNADQRQYPASLTKMMTSYVVGQAIKQGKIHNSDMVTIGESAWGRNFSDSSKMFLNLNQQVSVEDLNKGVIIVSGNDASVALAEHVSGTALNFVDTMNRYVQQFGLQNTLTNILPRVIWQLSVRILFAIYRKNIKSTRKKILPLTKSNNRTATVYCGIKR